MNVFLCVATFSTVVALQACSDERISLTLDEFAAEVTNDRVESLRFGCSDVVGVYRTRAQTFRVQRSQETDALIPLLRKNGVTPAVQDCRERPERVRAGPAR